jgi:hypothetical protein
VRSKCPYVDRGRLKAFLKYSLRKKGWELLSLSRTKLAKSNDRTVLPAFLVAIQVQTLNRHHVDRFVGYK